MNATGKGMIAFWLHKKGENWTLQSVDKESSPQVTFQKVKKNIKVNRTLNQSSILGFV